MKGAWLALLIYVKVYQGRLIAPNDEVLYKQLDIQCALGTKTFLAFLSFEDELFRKKMKIKENIRFYLKGAWLASVTYDKVHI